MRLKLNPKFYFRFRLLTCRFHNKPVRLTKELFQLEMLNSEFIFDQDELDLIGNRFFQFTTGEVRNLL